MSEHIPEMQPGRVFFDIKGFGSGKANFHGSLAQMIFHTLEHLVQKAASNITANNADLKKLGKLQKDITKMMSLFNELMEASTSKQPLAQSKADQIGKELNAAATSAGEIIKGIKDPMLKQLLGKALQGIEAVFSSKGMMSQIERIWKDIQQMNKMVVELGWTHGGPSVAQFFGAYGKLLADFSIFQGQMKKYEGMFGNAPWMKAFKNVAANFQAYFNEVSDIYPYTSNYTGAPLAQMYAEYKNGDISAARNWMNNCGLAIDNPTDYGISAGWIGSQQDVAAVENSVNAVKGDKIPPGDMVQLLYQMLIAKNPSTDFPDLYTQWQDAIADAQKMSNDRNAMSNQTIAAINASIAAMKSEIRFFDKQMTAVIRDVDFSLGKLTGQG